MIALPALASVALAGGGVALGTAWDLSVIGIILLAAGFSAFSFVRVIGAYLDKPRERAATPGAWTRDRAVILALLGLLTLIAWGIVLFKGDTSGTKLFLAGLATFALLSYAACYCTTRGSNARWLIGSLSCAMAGINGNYFAGASTVMAANAAGVQQATSNWEQVQAHIDPALNAIRKQLNVVIANTEEIKKDTSSLLTIAAIEAQIDLVDKNPKLTQAVKWELMEPLLKQRVNITQANVQSDQFDAKTQATVKNIFKDAPKVVRFAALARVGLDKEADELAAEIERTTTGLSDADKYEFFVARGDRFWNAWDYWNAATWYAQAMAIRVDDPAVVYRAARSATLAPGRATYTQDVQLAQSWVQRCLAQLAKQPGASAIDTARLYATLATTLRQQGKAGESIDPAREALRRLAIEGDAPAGQTFQILIDAAETLHNAMVLPEATVAVDRAVAAAEAAAGPESAEAAFTYASRAGIRAARGLPREAEEDITRAISWYAAQFPRDERTLANLYVWRATIRQGRGLLQEAEEDIARAIAWNEAQSPRDERVLANEYTSRASIRLFRGLPKEAEEDISRAIAWEEAQTQPNYQELAVRYAWRALIRRDLQQFAEARADINAAMNWWLSNLPHDEQGLGVLRTAKASIDAAEGK